MDVKIKNPFVLSLQKKFEKALLGFEPFEEKPRLGVAVSGGPDSLALTFLANDWAKKNSGSIIAFTIDHGIRKESKAESLYVKNILSSNGIEHHIHRYSGKKPSAGIQDFAREIRYRYLSEMCKKHEILHLFIAHHSQDQNETILMREWQGSGKIGLAGISAIIEMDSCRILRPLLKIGPHELKKYLDYMGVDWIDDYSNLNKNFLRTKARDYLKKNNLNIKKDGSTIRRKYESSIASWLSSYAEIFPLGYMKFKLYDLIKVEPDIRSYIIRQSILTISGKKYHPSEKSTENILKNLKFKNKTWSLGGCLICSKGEEIYIIREIGRINEKLKITNGINFIWDNRFQILITTNLIGDFWIAALKEEGLREIEEIRPKLSKKPLERLIYMGLPALWSSEGVVACSQLSYNNSEDLSYYSQFEPRHRLIPCSFVIVND
ncbi:tRNA lysidine(34) synthetase TilS [Alphaproteobacteria bacterium]|nr:tRNA lysidine(34) synthetase TilS [Alphaproteobacteria bacterium]